MIYTITGIVLLLFVSVVLMMLELSENNPFTGVGDLFLWKSFVEPFIQDVKVNFLNLYISQISTTFLVTVFLSMLGDKDTELYWTSTVKYKLINPKGSSLIDFTLYSFCTLAISFFAIVFQAKWCFIFSFLVNVYFLIVITWRMIVALFGREKIKKELFLK